MDNPLEKPVFVLGVGRCGSTYVQRLITYNRYTWLWGEHDGILENFVRQFNYIKSSKALNDFSYKFANLDLFERLERGDNITAWMLPFTSSDIDNLGSDFLHWLFAKYLPNGYSRWGFKEIRYGPDSGVPEWLIELFPNCKIVHVVRHPFASIDSALRAWHSDLVVALNENTDNAENEKKIENAFNVHFERWLSYTRYFMGLQSKFNLQIATFRIEEIDQSINRLFEFLEENISAAVIMEKSSGAKNQSKYSQFKLDGYEKWFEQQYRERIEFIKGTAKQIGYCL